MAIKYLIDDCCQHNNLLDAGFFKVGGIEYPMKLLWNRGRWIYMAIADRIRQLRSERRWTQAELGEKVLIKLAEVFDVTLDY